MEGQIGRAMDVLQKNLPRLPPTNIPELLERSLRDIMQAGRSGRLDAHQAAALIDGTKITAGQRSLAALPIAQLQPLIRTTFSSRCSWALFTVEWMASLDHLFSLLHADRKEPRRVLEVCAGRGVLTVPMRSRGIEWTATDERPPSDANPEDVSRIGAVAALKAQLGESDSKPLTAVFWAWWSKPRAQKKRKAAATEDVSPGTAEAACEVDEDRQLAEFCSEAKIPMVFVGEPKGGITGSVALWESGPYEIMTAADFIVSAPGSNFEFCDVPNWHGFADRTFVILPKESRP